jgi:PAS domain S-box-containing protein
MKEMPKKITCAEDFVSNQLPSPGDFVLRYAALAGIWILLSDYLVATFFQDSTQLHFASTFKGIAFVAFTSMVLYWLTRRLLNQIKAASAAKECAFADKERAYKLFTEILDKSSDAIFAKDLDGKYLLFNTEAARVTGKRPDQVLGNDDAAIFALEQAQMVRKNDLDVINQNRTITYEEILRTKDGDVTFLATKGLIHNANGLVIGLFGISRDITARSNAARALKLSEAWLRESQQIAGIGSYLLDISTGDWVSSPILDGLLGIDGSYPHTVTGWTELIHPDDREMMASYFANEVVGIGKPFNKEYRIQRQDDQEVRWVNGLGELEFGSEPDGQNRPVKMIGTIQDITERKFYEEALELAKLNAEAASIAKSRFIATISHEIRTPLNGVLGMAQLLQMPNLTETERIEFARTIVHSGDTLLTLLNDILDLSKVESGKIQLEPHEVNPLDAIEEVGILFSELANSKGLGLQTAWHGPSAQCYLTDPIRLRQMLSNLLSNAIKFTSEGSVTIDAYELENDGSYACLEFAVTDTGIGLSHEVQSLLFRPFFQADASITRTHGGTGLGLSIVKSLANAMDGDVGVVSEIGKGARIWFRIRAELVPN